MFHLLKSHNHRLYCECSCYNYVVVVVFCLWYNSMESLWEPFTFHNNCQFMRCVSCLFRRRYRRRKKTFSTIIHKQSNAILTCLISNRLLFHFPARPINKHQMNVRIFRYLNAFFMQNKEKITIFKCRFQDTFLSDGARLNGNKINVNCSSDYWYYANMCKLIRRQRITIFFFLGFVLQILSNSIVLRCAKKWRCFFRLFDKILKFTAKISDKHLPLVLCWLWLKNRRKINRFMENYVNRRFFTKKPTRKT